MKALVYTQPNEVQLHERPEPTLADGEVLMRIDAAGIRGSDMHAFHGHDPRRQPGLVLGHEFAATVLHSASAGWQAGQRVTGNPLITCGRCEFCLQGPRQPVRTAHDGGHAAARRLCRAHEHPRQLPDHTARRPGRGGRRPHRACRHRPACDQSVDEGPGAPAARMPGAGAGRRRHRHAGRAAVAPLRRGPAGPGRAARRPPRVGSAARALCCLRPAPCRSPERRLRLRAASTSSSTRWAARSHASRRWPLSSQAGW